MINFEQLEQNREAYRTKFTKASPFSYLVIDEFCEPGALRELIEEVPDPDSGNVNQSRDYIFAKNKFEKSNFQTCGPKSKELFDDLMSPRMQQWLQFITGDPVFVDPKFHGGGYHQGGGGSFLDMHADFNYHPIQKDWFRNLNLLLYLNDEWQPSYGGSLKLRHRETGESREVEPLFNRCLLMHTREYTLHGYDPIAFPQGQYRRSVAAYAYHLDKIGEHGSARSVTWFPEKGGGLKRMIGKAWPSLVSIKTKMFGSGTARNQ